jgi:hypothetical protein
VSLGVLGGIAKRMHYAMSYSLATRLGFIELSKTKLDLNKTQYLSIIFGFPHARSNFLEEWVTFSLCTAIISCDGIGGMLQF